MKITPDPNCPYTCPQCGRRLGDWGGYWGCDCRFSNNTTVKKHFVTFYSPGTFVAEETTKEIDAWSPDLAKRMAADIKERYGAVPYGFQFSTRTRTDKDLDSKVTARSCMYFINCKVLTLADVEKLAKENRKYETLLANMKENRFARVVETINGWKWCQPLTDKDIVL